VTRGVSSKPVSFIGLCRPALRQPPMKVSARTGIGDKATRHLLQRGVCLSGAGARTWGAPFVHTAKIDRRDK